MTPLFWIALTWVLACVFVGRLPLHQRFLPGAVLVITALPILVSIGVSLGWLSALFAGAAIVSMFPNVYRLAVARYRSEDLQLNAHLFRYLVVPGDI